MDTDFYILRIDRYANDNRPLLSYKSENMPVLCDDHAIDRYDFNGSDYVYLEFPPDFHN